MKQPMKRSVFFAKVALAATSIGLAMNAPAAAAAKSPTFFFFFLGAIACAFAGTALGTKD